MGTLFVINPNYSQTVTDGIAAALAPLQGMGAPIACLTLAEGPPGIESQSQADETIAPMLRLAASLEDQAAGLVIACFGDPGVHALRDRTAKPVLGIQEAAVSTALTLGVADLADPAITRERLLETGRTLRDQDGAEVLTLGCAGMARYRPDLEQALQIPVIDLCQAAASMALGRIALSQTHKPGA